MQAPPWVTGAAAVAVMLAWIASLAIGAIRQDWAALTITTPLMMMLAGYAFGLRISRKAKEETDAEEAASDRWSHLP